MHKLNWKRCRSHVAAGALALGATLSLMPVQSVMAQVRSLPDFTDLVKTTASAEGWALRKPVAGFQPMSCHKRPRTAATGGEPMQWVFSDGLASVSIFVEPYDAPRHLQEARMSMGATQSLTRRLDAYWLTVMGEVPLATLAQFADSLERRK